MQTRREAAQGFTLIEILVVMAMIGFLVALALPDLLPSRIWANEAAALSDLREAGTKTMQGNSEGAPLVCPSPLGAWSATKSGYLRGCTNGVYWATPMTQNVTGVRGFSIDGTGRICFTTDGSIPVMNGNCPTIQ